MVDSVAMHRIFNDIYSFFSNIFDGQRWYAITFIAFWVYFLYRITRVYLWRKFGMEYIKIDPDKFSYKRSIFGYGKANEFLSKNIKKIQLEDFDNKSFSKTYNESFWILGGGVIKITSIDNQLNLGSQLNSVDASKLIKIISHILTNKIKNLVQKHSFLYALFHGHLLLPLISYF